MNQFEFPSFPCNHNPLSVEEGADVLEKWRSGHSTKAERRRKNSAKENGKKLKAYKALLVSDDEEDETEADSVQCTPRCN